MPNLVYPSLYLGNVLGIDVTSAVQSDQNLIDVAPDAFHQPVGFRNIAVVGSEVNPRANAVTDILRFVLIPELLTLIAIRLKIQT